MSRKTTLGAVGFCMGGGFVLGLTLLLGEKIGVTGKQDQFYPAADAHALEQQIRDESSADVEFFYYPDGHAFMNEQNHIGTYDADSAALTWSRMTDFFNERLGGTAD